MTRSPQDQGRVIHQHLLRAEALDAWEPIDGLAIVTCKVRVRSGAYDAWEPRVYEFLRTQDGWTIDTNPGYLRCESWQQIVGWLCYMQPVEIDLITTA